MTHPSDNAWLDPPPRRWRWVIPAIGWDGGLPVLVALAPEVLRRSGVEAGVTQFFSIGVIPAVAALTRAHFGQRQLARFGHTGHAWGRQALFALALCALMFFEVYLGMMQAVGGPPPLWAWEIVGGAYLIYLALILSAVRPPEV